MGADLELNVRSLGDGSPVVVCAGEVDVTNVGTFRDALVEASTSPRLVADLSDLAYLDSAGVEVLFAVAHRTALEIVAGPECRVRRLLDVVSLGSIATIVGEAPG